MQNQVVYYFGKSIYRQSTAFLVSTLDSMDDILCGDIKIKRSKI